VVGRESILWLHVDHVLIHNAPAPIDENIVEPAQADSIKMISRRSRRNARELRARDDAGRLEEPAVPRIGRGVEIAGDEHAVRRIAEVDPREDNGDGVQSSTLGQVLVRVVDPEGAAGLAVAESHPRANALGAQP
jgi:hypothetical protein